MSTESLKPYTIQVTFSDPAMRGKLDALQRAMGESIGGTKVTQHTAIQRLLRDADPEFYRTDFPRLCAQERVAATRKD